MVLRKVTIWKKAAREEEKPSHVEESSKKAAAASSGTRGIEKVETTWWSRLKPFGQISYLVRTKCFPLPLSKLLLQVSSYATMFNSNLKLYNFYDCLCDLSL